MPIRYLDEVIVPAGRIRREFRPEAIEELARSILEVGLLHPPVVEADGTLLAGERRLRALQLIHSRGLTYHCNGKFIAHGLIMTTDIRELSRSQRLQAEVDENTVRIDISWQEKAEAVAMLHQLRQMQAGELALADGTPPAEVTLAAIAAEVKDKPPEEVSYRDERDIRADLMVQTWMESHPADQEVREAKSRSDALRVIEIRLEDEHRAALARRFLQRKPAEGHVIELGDMRNLLPQIPADTFDCIITDPPWGVDSHAWENQNAIRQHTYLDDMHTFEAIHEKLATDGYRICKPRAHLYLFCAFRKFEDLRRLFAAAGWDVWPQPLIWWKGTNSGIAPRPEHGPRQTYECILFANKGNKRVLSLRPDVIFAPSGTLLRAAEKPPSVYWELLARTCLPGDEVLDPCCGTGPLLPAANALKLRATLYDVAEDAIGLASQRLSEQFVPTNVKAFEEGTAERGGVRHAR
jgi:site-specific DNA-methyltransferase (adenine-specific)